MRFLDFVKVLKLKIETLSNGTLSRSINTFPTTLQTPPEVKKTHPFLQFMAPAGKVMVEARLDKAAYSPGDVVKVHVDMELDSGVKIERIKVAFLQQHIFFIL